MDVSAVADSGAIGDIRFTAPVKSTDALKRFQ